MQDAPCQEPDLGAIRSQLIHWYDGGRRHLPWRATRDPYAILVAEVMLQQTRVETVLPYYTRFLQRFPTASHLAAAAEEEVLRYWQGLGYYRRARHLWRAARLLVEQHGGQVPADPAALRALPGVGAYTAGAVLSIAFGLPVPAIDGNARRVLSRLFSLPADDGGAEGRHRLRRLATHLVQGPRPGDVNQAIMDLGTLVCTPRRPRCDRCPVAEHCLARASGEPERWPRRQPRGPVPTEALVVACCLDGDRLALVRRPPSGLLAGLWALPSIRLESGETWAQARLRLKVLLERALGRACRWRPRGWRGHWEFSHRRWDLRAYVAVVTSEVLGSFRGNATPFPRVEERSARGMRDTPDGAVGAGQPERAEWTSLQAREREPESLPWWAADGGGGSVHWVPLAQLDRWPMAAVDRKILRELLALDG